MSTKVILSDSRIYDMGRYGKIIHYIEVINGVYPRIEGRYEIYDGWDALVKKRGGIPIADLWEVEQYTKKCEENPFWVCPKWYEENAQNVYQRAVGGA